MSTSGKGSSSLSGFWEVLQNDPSQYYGIILTIIVVITVRVFVRKYLLPKQNANVSGSLKAINVYPIKSCKGITASKWKINKYGLEHDREWMVIDSESNRFQTQRQLPKMALISPSLKQENSQEMLYVDYPGMPTLKVSLSGNSNKQQTLRYVGIWDDQTTGIDEGDQAAAWFQQVLNKPTLRLVRVPPNNSRKVPPEYNSEKGLNLVNFSDAFPFLLISEGSLGELNKRMQQGQSKSLPMNRFRPNLVIDGVSAFAEDSFKRFKIGDVMFLGAKKCTRCKLTTVDQLSGSFDGEEPLRTLRTFRKGLLKGGEEVCFGENLIHMGVGQVEVGQSVILYETK